MITLEEVSATILKKVSVLDGEDINSAEISAYLDGLVASLGIAAVAIAKKQGSCSRFVSVRGRMDFDELGEDELLCKLADCSGLPKVTCKELLEAINDLLSQEFKNTDRVLVECIGEWRRNRSYYTLFLTPNLAVPNI